MKSTNIEDIYRMSPLQAGLVFHSLQEPESGLYFEQSVCELVGALDADALWQAWEEVVARHAVLRTAFVWEGLAEPVQVVSRRVAVPREQHDWEALSEDERTRRFDAFLAADRARGWRLNAAPLWRLALLRLDARRWRLVWSQHHVLLDGWSLPVLLGEMFQLYAARTQGARVALPPVSPFRDYIKWLSAQDADAAEAHWRGVVGDWSVPTPAPGARREALRGPRSYVEHTLTLSEERTGAVERWARGHQITLSTLVQALWALLVGRAAGEREVVYALTIAGRSEDLPGSERMVGLLINTVPMRVRVAGPEPVDEWLRGVQARQAAAQRYGYAPLSQVQAWSGVPAGVPMFDTLVVFENYPRLTTSAKAGANDGANEGTNDGASGSASARDVPGVALRPGVARTNYALTLAAMPGERLTLRLTVDAARVDTGVSEALLPRLERMLDRLMTGADRLADVARSEHADADIRAWTHGAAIAESWAGTVAERIAVRAIERPDAVAVECDGSAVTYGALDVRATRLARVLRTRGVGPEARVGVCLERSNDLVVTLLAIWKAGGVYVPLDPAYPAARIEAMLSAAPVALIVTQSAVADRVSARGAPTRLLRLDDEQMSEQGRGAIDAIAPLPAVDPATLAYVIYTSGSTGAPKGVEVTHDSLRHTLCATERWFRADDRMPWMASMGFDIALVELLAPLLAGETVAIWSRARVLDLSDVTAALTQITVLHAVPSWMAQLVDHLRTQPRTLALRQILVGGEQVPSALLHGLAATLPDAAIDVLYGPTEGTILAGAVTVDREDISASPLVGRPLPNTQLYVLDADGAHVEAGATGELNIGGAGVARGYTGQPALTATRFVPDPFGGVPGARLYRTGDRGRWQANGTLEYVGRTDQQVKVRGHRIELGEIESVLRQHPAIRDVVAIVREDAGHARLVAYVVRRADASNAVEIDAMALQAFLRERLPAYMTPSAFVFPDALPLTAHGKVNRAALPAPALDVELPTDVDPRSSTEAALAEIWSAVLGRARVGIHENFFELGGDSILSLQVVSRARQRGLRVTTRQIFEQPTIALLAAAADAADQAGGDQGTITGPVALTPMQRWFFTQALDTPSHWNQAILLRLASDVDPAGVRAALAAIVSHHDALRMRVEPAADSAAGGWRQVNLPDEPAAWWQETHVATAADIASAADAVQASLDLVSGPIQRAVCIHVDEEASARLLWVVHHLVIDGVSWRILLEDLAHAYAQWARGDAIALPAKSASFQQWAAARVAYGASDDLRARELTYWIEQTAIEQTAIERTRAAVAISVDAPDGGNTTADADRVGASLRPDETASLVHTAPGALRATVEELLVAAAARAYGAWSGCEDLVLALEGHGRDDTRGGLDVARTVGWFTTVYPVRLRTSGADAATLLTDVKRRLRAAPDRGIGYGLLRYIGRAPKLADAIAPDVSFNYLGQWDTVLASPATASSDVPDVSSEVTARADASTRAPAAFTWAAESTGASSSPRNRRAYAIELTAAIADRQVHIGCTYSRQQYRRDTIARLVSAWADAVRELLTAAAAADLSACTPEDFPLAQVPASLLTTLAATRQPIGDIYRASPLQTGMLFHSLREPESGLYFEQSVCDLDGPLDPAALWAAWRDAMTRHAVLRTAFVWEGLTEPVQVVYRDVPVPREEHDWQSLSAEEQMRRFEAFLAADRARGWRLDSAPLWRLALLRLGARRWRLVWSQHHVLLDGWSLPVLLNDVWRGYALHTTHRKAADRGSTDRDGADRDVADRQGAARDGADHESVRPYRDYIAWIAKQDPAAAETHWRGVVGDRSAPTPVPSARRLPGRGPRRYAEHAFALSPEQTIALEQWARRQQVTLSTCVQALWALLLSRTTSDRDIVYGLTISGRPADLPGADRMVGLLINTVPMRVVIPPASTPGAWLREVQTQQAAAQQYGYTSLAQVQTWSAAPAGTPLFETLVVFENYPGLATSASSSLSPSAPRADRDVTVGLRPGVERTNFPLTLAAIPGERLTLRLTVDTERVDDTHGATLLPRIGVMIDALVSDVDRVEALTKDADASARAWTRGPASAEPWKGTAAERIAAHAIEQPDAVAVEWDGAAVTYGALDARATRLAHVLRARGVGPEARVGVCLERSNDLVVTLLAIWKAGGVYVPLDPSYPAARIEAMLSAAPIALIVTSTAMEDRVSPRGSLLLRLDDDPISVQSPGSADAIAPLPAVDPATLAYVIYTSGSTGAPKGVEVTHDSLRHTLCAAERWFRAGDRMPWMASMGFDIALVELLAPLLAGATVAIWSRARVLDLSDVTAALTQITVLHAVPSWMAQLVDHLRTQPRTLALRQILVGGEQVPSALLHGLAATLPDAAIDVLYGPTEGTILAGAVTVDRGNISAAPLVGRPLPNTQLYVLDADGVQVEAGVTGELYIGGAGVTRGYTGQPALTAARFAPDPFGDIVGARLYRTGDRCRWQTNGTLEYIGRTDQQVKVRGHRIELGEIESVLRQHPAIRDVVAIVREDAGHPRIVAYVVRRAAADVGSNASDAVSIDAAVLQTFLRERLPVYLTPSAFVFLDALPLTAHGKVNRAALPAPALETAADATTDPRTPAETALADIWAAVLGRERVGTDENFFDLGGDSILSLQVVSRARQRGLRVSARQIFEQPTIALLAAAADAAEQAGGDQGLVSGEVALTPIQRWFFEQRFASSSHWNQAALLRLAPRVDAAGLRAALVAIVSHHDALRMRYEPSTDAAAGGWRQVNLADDASEWWQERRVATAADIGAVATGVQASLDLVSGPVQRVVWIRVDEDASARLLWVVHHLVIDGVSWRILLEDLAHAYAQWARGDAIALPAKSASFQQWAAARTAYGTSDALRAEELSYWIAQTTTSARVPVDVDVLVADGANTIASAERASASLSAADTQALVRQAPGALRATVEELLLASAAQAYGAWSGQPELLVELEGHGRDEGRDGVDVARTVGWFTTIYPVRLPARAASVDALLPAIKRRLRAAPDRGAGYGLLRFVSGAPELADRSVDVSFNYLGQWDTVLAPSPRATGDAQADATAAARGDAVFTWADESSGPSCDPRNHRAYLLELSAAIAGGQLHIGCTCSRHRHHRDTIERLVSAWIAALRALLHASAEPEAMAYSPGDFPLAPLAEEEFAAAVDELFLET